MIFYYTNRARVMSLSDGRAKMSKSAENDLSRINLLDSPDEIRRKVKKCKTDTFVGLEWDNPERPEANNLLTILLAVSKDKGRTKEDIANEVKDMSWGSFKPLLAEAIVDHLEPMQRQYREVMADSSQLEKILEEGREKAEAVAEQSLIAAKQAIGLHLPARRTYFTTSSSAPSCSSNVSHDSTAAKTAAAPSPPAMAKQE